MTDSKDTFPPTPAIACHNTFANACHSKTGFSQKAHFRRMTMGIQSSAARNRLLVAFGCMLMFGSVNVLFHVVPNQKVESFGGIWRGSQSQGSQVQASLNNPSASPTCRRFPQFSEPSPRIPQLDPELPPFPESVIKLFDNPLQFESRPSSPPKVIHHPPPSTLFVLFDCFSMLPPSHLVSGGCV